MWWLLMSRITLIKKAMNFCSETYQLLQNKVNVFNLPNFEQLMGTPEFQEMKSFFQNFQLFVQKLFLDTKAFLHGKIPQEGMGVQQVEHFSNKEADKFLNDGVLQLMGFFRMKKREFSPKTAKVYMEGVIYLFFNIELVKKFPLEAFKNSTNWQQFCLLLNSKSSEEIERKMNSFYQNNQHS